MMTARTRAGQHAIMRHVLQQVLQQVDDSPLAKALSKGGYDIIADVLGMSNSDIDILDYDEREDDTIVTLPLLPARKNLIRALQAFVRYQHSTGNPISDYLTVTAAEFNEFRVSVYNPNVPITAPSSSPRITTAHSTTVVATSKQGIKHDKSHYVALREDKQWDSWRRSTLATARSHSCEEVFDPTFVPASPVAKELFAEKQKFISSVFEDKIQTDVGNAEQQLWDRFSSQAKATIFGIGKTPPPRTPRQLNLNNISAANYLCIVKLHEQHSQLTAPFGDAASTPHDSNHVEPASTIDRGPDLSSW